MRIVIGKVCVIVKSVPTLTFCPICHLLRRRKPELSCPTCGRSALGARQLINELFQQVTDWINAHICSLTVAESITKARYCQVELAHFGRPPLCKIV